MRCGIGGTVEHLAEGAISQDMPECCAGLLKQLALMGNEQETRLAASL